MTQIFEFLFTIFVIDGNKFMVNLNKFVLLFPTNYILYGINSFRLLKLMELCELIGQHSIECNNSL
jgi:hypothetical protein